MIREIEIKNRLGLHARPAVIFVNIACKFESSIYIKKDGRRVSAKSIMGVLSLKVKCKDKIIIEAEGRDAKEAIEALANIIERRFDEE